MQNLRSFPKYIRQNFTIVWGTVALGIIFASGLAYFFAPRIWGNTDTPVNTSYAQTHRGHLIRLDANAADGRVLFLGSSTLQGMDATPVTPFALNLALGGDTVQQLAQRLQNYRSLANAAAIVLNIGFNDVMQNCRPPLGKALDNLFVQFPNEIPLIVVGLQGVSPEHQRQDCAGRITEHLIAANIELARRCATVRQCRFVSNPLPEYLDANTSSKLHENDGIHINPMAYDLLRNALHEALLALAPELASRQTPQ